MSKKCGECRYHHRDYHYCQADKECKSIHPESPACENFAVRTITNSNRIRALSDAALAELFVHGLAYDVNYEEWYSTLLPGTVCFSSKQKALEATLEELKKEVKDE